MRKPATSLPLVGQLLFAEEGDGTITIDCVLTRDGSGAASVPVTLEARFPGRAQAEAALDLLGAWASEAAAVAVRILEGPRGTEVEIITATGRLVLEPEQ
jgi:hypothetical protein